MQEKLLQIVVTTLLVAIQNYDSGKRHVTVVLILVVDGFILPPMMIF